MIIEKPSQILHEITEIFKNEVNTFIKDNPEIFTDEILRKFKIFTLTNVSVYGIDLFRYKPSKTKYGVKQLQTSILTYLDRWAQVPYTASVDYFDDNDGKIYIERLEIIIKTDVLSEMILDNIYRIDVFKELTKIDARHEIGHIVDYILRYHNTSITIEQCIEQNIEDDQAKNEYMKWKKQILDDYYATNRQDNSVFRTIEERYYQLPSESRADTLGKVDRQRYMELLHNQTPPKAIKIEIVDQE